MISAFFKCSQRNRRGVHSLIAVSMLIGFTLIGAGMLFAVLVDYRDVSLNTSECSLSNLSLHIVGDSRAYFIASLHNLGSGVITSATIIFTDDSGIEHGFSDDSLVIDPGYTWDVMDTFPASISKKDYVVNAMAITIDGSTIVCSSLYAVHS